MIKSFRRITLVIIYLTIVSSCQSIDPEPPSVKGIEIPNIQHLPSKVDLPVSINLKKYFNQLETSVSHMHSDSIEACEGLRYAYMFKRSPFSIKGFGNKVNLSFQGEYWIKFSYCAKCEFNECKVPKLGGSCGQEGEPLRKIKIGYSSVFKLLNNYKLHSTTSLITLDPIDKCKITILNINATDKLIDYINGPLTKVGHKMDERIAAIDLKPKLQEIWEKISKEIKLGHLGYLSINPMELSYRSLELQGTILKTRLGVVVEPVISTISNPQQLTPLPNLSDYSPGNGFDVYFDILVGYDSLSNHLKKHVVGRRINLRDHSVLITNVKVYGIGNHKVVIAIDFKEGKEGTIYFTGTPHYNIKTNELTLPDLEFDCRTKDLLIEINKWVYNDKITNWLQEQAKFNFSRLVDKGKQKFEEGINRSLGDNVILSGNVRSLNIQAVYPADSKLLLRAFAQGTLEVIVK